MLITYTNADDATKKGLIYSVAGNGPVTDPSFFFDERDGQYKTYVPSLTARRHPYVEELEVGCLLQECT